jgi:N-acetyl-anhydromuramyl-L-alanine amidase AmpD
MKKVYEGRNRTMRSVSDAVFPMEVMTEGWRPPRVVPRLLPYAQWEDEYRAYFQRHTGHPTLTLQPTILVMHYTACSTFEAAWSVFYGGANMSAGDRGTVWGHPSVHFMIDRDGTIYQLMPLDRRATGTYGVNHCALQVEMVAANEADLVNNPDLLKASFRLARMLTRKFAIPLSKVYGHYDVSAGVSVVPEYLDKADSVHPTSYPASSARTDPGPVYMSWLEYYLQYAR